jgi:hypothetical protein
MIILSRKLAVSAAACGLFVTAHAGEAAAAAIAYTDFGTFQGAVSALTTESFDTAPWSSVGAKPQGIANLGVSWTAANALWTTDATSYSASFSITSTDGTVGGTDIFDWIEAVLPSGVTAVGGWITSWRQLHDSELRAYDALDNLLGSVSVGGTGSGYAFLGLTTDSDIAKVRFVSTNVTNAVGDDIALDDFSFGVGGASIPVPAPSSLVLFGAALAALLAGAPRSRASGRGAHDALDRRTLADIGIDPGTGLSAARHIDFDRLRCSPHD